MQADLPVERIRARAETWVLGDQPHVPLRVEQVAGVALVRLVHGVAPLRLVVVPVEARVRVPAVIRVDREDVARPQRGPGRDVEARVVGAAKPPAAERERGCRALVLDLDPLRVGLLLVDAHRIPVDPHAQRHVLLRAAAAVRRVPEALALLTSLLPDLVVGLVPGPLRVAERQPQGVSLADEDRADARPVALVAHPDSAADAPE